MNDKEYLTCTEIAKLTKTMPAHIARDFANARKKQYVFCGRICTSYLKEDVLKIFTEKEKRREKTKQRYSARPIKMKNKNYKCKGSLTDKEYIKLKNAWYGMMRRCYTNDRPDYHHYREKNITMCKEWLDNFESFFYWSLDNGFDIDLTLDRIDNNKGYYPENCRWATSREQNNNSSQNKRYYYNGKSQTIGEWANEYGLNYDVVFSRIHYQHWSIEKTLNTPVRKISKSNNK